jgi:hypothetical protein
MALDKMGYVYEWTAGRWGHPRPAAVENVTPPAPEPPAAGTPS